MAVGLPMGKLGMSFGLIPYSSVGYKTGFTNYQTATLEMEDMKETEVSTKHF